MPLWLGLVDFEKAFDTVEHAPLWDALEELGVEAEYIDLLKTLYREQASTVLVGEESRTFALERGVKQGDPLSSLLFLAVMEIIFRRLKTRWGRLNLRRSGSYYGVVVDDARDPLTNLRFADDVLLVSTSRKDVKRMIAELAKEALKFGLKLHAGKTKILTNESTSRQTPVSCGGQDVHILQEGESEKYLGRKLSIDEFHNTELDNRLAMGWASFFKLKGALCNRQVPLKDRLKLFESSVTPCVLYACGAWTMKTDMDHKLRSTWRRMLRWMIKPSRAEDEEWVDYIIRATRICEALALRHGCSDWTGLQRKRKRELAAKSALVRDGRWSRRLLNWVPWFRCVPHRNVGHPVKRWADEF